MTTIVSSQTEMKSAMGIKIVELMTLLEQASQIPTLTPSTSGTLQGGSTSHGRSRLVLILPTSVRLPSGSQIEKTGFIEVDLAGIPIETLQIVQVQVHEELRERELSNYRQNEKLKKDTDQLQEQNESISVKLTQKEYEKRKLTQVIRYLCVELPKCNIQLETPLLQKVKIIATRAKELEDTIEKMDMEHKAHIVELEAKAPETPLVECEERAQALQAFLATIAKHLEDAQKLLDETTNAWTTMNNIEDLVNVHEAIQKTQREMDTIVAGMKDLPAIQHMIKMGETKKL